MKRDIERRTKLKKQFSAFYQKFIIIDAIDAKNNTSQDICSKYKSSCTHNSRSPLTLGEKCCAISHLKALESFLETDSDSCIIIEDDLIGNDNDLICAIKIVNKIPSGSLIILGGQQGLKNSKFLCGKKEFDDNTWKIPSYSYPFITRACCYGITRQAAIKVIESQNECLTRSDDWEYFCRNKKIQIFYSNIFSHPKGLEKSSLENERKASGKIEKIKRDGLDKILIRYLHKILIIAHIILKKVERVNIK